MIEISDLVRMLRECAPGAVLAVRTHSLQIKHAGRLTQFSKGPGKPKSPEDARGQEHERVVRKVAQFLELDRRCVERYFPGLIPRDR